MSVHKAKKELKGENNRKKSCFQSAFSLTLVLIRLLERLL